MGRKAGYASIAIGSFSSCLYLVGLLLPLHSVGIYSLHKQILRFHIHTVWGVEEACANEFASRRAPAEDQRRHRSESKAWEGGCASGDRVVSLQSMSQRWCSALLDMQRPGLCKGMEYAFVFGAVVLAVALGNALAVQAAVCYLVYGYATRAPSRRARRTAQGLTALGCAVMLLVLVGYAVVVTVQIDSGEHRLQIVRPFFDKTKATGYGYGSFLLWTGLLAQAVQLFALQHLPGQGEEAAMEAKEQLKFERDYGAAARLPQPPQPMPTAVAMGPPAPLAGASGGGDGAAFGIP